MADQKDEDEDIAEELAFERLSAAGADPDVASDFLRAKTAVLRKQLKTIIEELIEPWFAELSEGKSVERWQSPIASLLMLGETDTGIDVIDLGDCRLATLDANALAELAISDTAPFDDHHASAEYRRSVGKRIFARKLGETFNLREAA